MQYHKLRLNMALSSSTVPFGTELRNFNDYYVYGSTLGGGMVTTFNVRSFLNDNKNKVIINDFIGYLTGTTTDDELVKILGDDEQLTTIFNEFYETTIMGGQQTSPLVIERTMAHVASIPLQVSDHLWNGVSNPLGLENVPQSIDGSTRYTEVMNVQSRFSVDDSYFIPVFIKQTHEENTRQSYNECPTRLSLILDPATFNNGITEAVEIMERSPSIIVVREDDGSNANAQPIANRFITVANDLVNRCYDSQCVDNRYCDLLYFANLRIMQVNVINTEHIRGLLGGEPSDLTEGMVLNVLMEEMIRQGEPVAFPIFSCMFD